MYNFTREITISESLAASAFSLSDEYYLHGTILLYSCFRGIYWSYSVKLSVNNELHVWNNTYRKENTMQKCLDNKYAIS